MTSAPQGATTRLFGGGLTRIDEHGQWTGIFKRPLVAQVRIGFTGLAGDRQADRRVHGGPEKAIHQYPVAHYERLALRFPAVGALLVPGSIGENVSADGFDESNVFLGDRFRLGSSVLQVSQPRSPCWKIDHRYGVAGMARLIAEEGLTGWYFRVLEEGVADPGQPLLLIDRPANAVSLAELWRVWQEHRPDPGELERLSAAPGLAAAWRQKLSDRLHWLRGGAARD